MARNYESIKILITRDYGLHYTRYPTVFEGYSDANWISNVKDLKSQNGYVHIGRSSSLMEILKTNGYCQIHNGI